MNDDIDSTYEEGREDGSTSDTVAFLRRRNAISHILRDTDAAYFLWRILSSTGIYHSVSGNNPHAMAVLSGKRDVGLTIIADLVEADPKAYLDLQVRAARGEFDDD